MWSRRVLRAGWALAPVLKVPAVLWEFFFGNAPSVFWTFVLIMFVTFVTLVVKQDNEYRQIATQAHITEHLKNNPCMIEMMPRWQKEVKRPLQYGDLLYGKRKCDEVWGNRNQMKEQMKVMEALK